MQYFKKTKGYSNHSNVMVPVTRGNSVISLNRTLQICVDRANGLYSCKLHFDIPAIPMFAEIPAEDIIKHIFFILEKHCVTEKSLTIKLSHSANGEKAYISFVSPDTVLNTIEIELYTGTPGVVVKEICDTDEIQSIVERVLKMFSYKNDSDKADV